MAGAADSGWSAPERDFDVFDGKGVVEAVLGDLGIAWGVGAPAGEPFHPGRSSAIEAGGDTIGAVGELHPRVAAALDLPGRVVAAELDVQALMRLASDVREVRGIPRFPPVRRDLAFVLDAAAAAGDVQAALEDAAGELLDSCLLFDLHTGPPLDPGTKSLAFSVDFRATDRTLVDAEAAEAVERIVARLSREFGARLRSG
jgi:phenylalanyl-tRNA synthetase beta chain